MAIPRRLEDSLHPDEPWFTLRGQDLLAPHALATYAALLRATAHGVVEGSGGDLRQVSRERLLAQASQVDDIAAWMIAFQADHPELTKLPD